ncbi:hypothetical protein Bca101_059193 [Brassica carinata]
MILGKRIMGKCDDPNGKFCSKLRQKTKKMAGLPLALQLVAYESIPLLLARLGGTDELKLIDCERLPQYTGLNLVDVLEAEHNPELVVQPMMEIGSEKPYIWGKWDDEINDRRVTYVLGLTESGHKFKKTLWWDGDAKEVLYNHEARKAAKKRKRQGATSRTAAGEGPVLRQRRVSTYFRWLVFVDDDKHEELAARVAVLENVVERMKRRLGRRKRQAVTHRRELLASGTALKRNKMMVVAVAEKESSSDEEDEEAGDQGEASSRDGGEDDSEPEGDVGAPKDSCSLESEDVGKGDADGQEQGSGCSKEESVAEDEEEEVDGSTADKNESEAMEVEVEQSSSEGPPPLLVPLKDGDGVPLQWVEEGVTDNRGGVLYRAMMSKTLYLTEDEGDKGEVGDDGDGSEPKDGLEDSVGLDKPVTVIFKAHGGDLGEGEMGAKVADAGVRNVGIKEPEDEAAGGPIKSTEGAGEEDSKDGTKVAEGKAEGESSRGDKDWADMGNPREDEMGDECGCLDNGDDGNKGGNDKTPEESRPSAEVDGNKEVEDDGMGEEVESERAKGGVRCIERIVPTVENIDLGYFEMVLLSNPKVLHLGAGKYDLDNQFFLELATPQKWVSSKHMEVFVDFVSERHAELLKKNRAMFVAPWFMGHLSGKARSFNAATYKGRVFSDPKLADRSLRRMDEVMALMTPIAKMLPYLVRKVYAAEFLMGHGLEPFGVDLMADGYQNTRTGDCGPVAVKFIELAATGVEEPEMEDLTDSLVDIFRKQYAMDVYKEWIVPL